ncbi:P-loop NTPase fold protein [Aliarcobacter lanthieri]|uniref:P-loop NTPase fold protein n=1 Tax=Aliarcobacter lanthieri TaxID=1355374 RepID=UPI003AAFE4B6
MENKIQYISNKPIGKDFFTGQSHEKIATSIAEHIIDETNSMKVIGLEGEWGSGKSNIIEIIKNKLKTTHYIYIYDSWGHQEDSQRRAFLEEMTEELEEKDLLEKNTKYKNINGKILNISWQEKIKYLLARKKETNKKTVPKLSIGLIIIALIVVLTPIFALISSLIGNSTQESIILKILFSSSLLILAITSFFIYSIYKRIKYGVWANLSSIFYLYKGKELENTTFEILSDLEPSVKEFKNWIKSISIGLKDKKLLIVYDNMDRLPPKKVEELWSSIHTFFAEEQYNNIHIIIPFDRKHLQKAFKYEDNETQINEFIDKTFSLIYRVTPPILTDWKKFFQIKFYEAFKDSENEELSLVLSIFDRLKERFTPRDIIVFINEVVSYKKIWQNEIPLRYIALFVLQKGEILKDTHKNILENNYLKTTNELFSKDNELQNYISALTFNVPVEQAYQVLLIRDLELTLRDEYNSLEINELARNKHFIEILEEVIKSNTLVLDKAIEVLSNLDKEKLQGENKEKRLEDIWNILVTKQLEHTIDKLSFNDNYKNLFFNSSNSSKLNLLNFLTEQFNNFKELNGKDYYESFKELDRFIKESTIEFNLQDKIKERETSNDVFLDYLQIAGNDYETYKLVTTYEELDTFVEDKIPNEIKNLHLVDLSHILSECDFKNTKEKIEQLIISNQLTKDNFYQILNIYKSISEDKPLAQIVTMPNLYQLLKEVTEKDLGFYDLCALRIKYSDQYNQMSCDVVPQFWQDKLLNILNSNDDIIIKEVAKQIEYYMGYGDLLLLLTRWQQPLLKEVCKNLVFNRYKGIRRMNINEILKNFENIKTSLEIHEKNLLESFEKWTKFAKEEINQENIQEVIVDYEFYNYSISISLELTDYINKTVEKFINSKEQETLIEEWNNNSSYIYNILYIFMKHNKIEKLPDNIFNALKEILLKISKSEIALAENDTMWSFFIDRADKSKLTPTIKDIRDYFIRENNIDSNLFQFFEKLFREIGGLNEKSGDVVRVILTKIASYDNCLNILLGNQDFYSKIITSVGNDAENLKDIIAVKLKENNENEELKKFAKKININIKEKNN